MRSTAHKLASRATFGKAVCRIMRKAMTKMMGQATRKRPWRTTGEWPHGWWRRPPTLSARRIMIQQTMRVLRLFSSDRRELGVVEAAELLGRPKSSISRLLRSMEAEGFLHRDEASGRFRLSLALAALGEIARASTSMQRLARPVLEELVERTGETSNLVVLDGSEAVNVEVVRSSRAVQHVGVLGRRLPLHATAAGKVLLAWAAPGVQDRILAGPLPALASRTLTDPAALARELACVRAQGYATAVRELEEELVAASAPVLDHRGAVVAAVTTSAPLSRMEGDRERWLLLVSRVTQAAATLSSALGFRREP